MLLFRQYRLFFTKIAEEPMLCRHLAEAALQSYPGTRFTRIPPPISG
jgi:hypothetical protein